MRRLLALSILLISITGCAGTRQQATACQQYLTAVNRDQNFSFEIISPPVGSITLPGDPESWSQKDDLNGWFTFKNKKSNDFVQYANGEKQGWDFYTSDLDSNAKFLNEHYEWESEYLTKYAIVDRTEIIEKEIDEDNEDYILFEVVRNDDTRNFIVLSIQKNRVIAVNLSTEDSRSSTLNKIREIYKSTKYK